MNHIDPLISCKDGAWLATDDGVYFIKTDYNLFANNKISAVKFDNQLSTVDTLQICSVENINAVVDSTMVGTTSIQWFKDGISLYQETSSVLKIIQPGNYNAILYDPCANLHMETNHLVVTVTTAPKFSLNYPDKVRSSNWFCSSVSCISFTAVVSKLVCTSCVSTLKVSVLTDSLVIKSGLKVYFIILCSLFKVRPSDVFRITSAWSKSLFNTWSRLINTPMSSFFKVNERYENCSYKAWVVHYTG